MSSLFITGHTGFIGRTLLEKIDATNYQEVFCLSRSQAAGGPVLHQSKQFRLIHGDVCDTESFKSQLANCETVIHLAAVTGKASQEEYFRVNTRGTELLLEACEKQGVKNFLYVSTIAAKFADKTHYYYAQSKELGERAVKRSSLNYTIIRPTIVVGKGAAVSKALSRLAMKPVLFMLGDGTTLIQPISIGDLVDSLLLALERPFCNEVFELGGPEQITFERFLKNIHRLYYHREPLVVHLPLRPLITLISFMEQHVSSKLPVSSGQLSAFKNDGTIETNMIFSQLAGQMKNVNEMLADVVGHE